MKIEGFVGNLDMSASNMSDVLGKLAVGDIVRAKVLNIAADELLLKLFDGTTFSAKSMSSLEVEQGDTVDFVVKNNSNKQLVLETIKGNENNQRVINDADSNIKKQLIELEIKPDKKNIEIAHEIKQNDLPLNKDVFDKIADTIIAFKNVTPQKAAYLIANNIVPEEKNISLLNHIIDEKQKIGPMLKDMFETLSKITDNEVMESISHAIKKSTEQKTSPSVKNDFSAYEVKQELIKNTVDKAFSASDVVKDPIIPNIKEKLTEFISANLENKLGDESKLKHTDKVSTEKAVSFLKENIKDFEKSSTYQGKSIDSILKNIFHKLQEGISQKTNTTTDEFPEKQVVERSEFEKDLEEVFQKLHVKIDENTSGEDLKIKKLYKDMYEKLETIKSAIEQSTTVHKDELLGKIDNLQNNLKFINDLNNHTSYIQIPLNMLDRNTTGELYVLKKGSRNKKIDPQNASVLVSLNTPNLGQIDSLINVNKKNISLNLRVEEQAIIGFIKENYIELYNSLSNKGYKLVDVKYRLIDEEVNAINVDRTIKKELELNKQSIDYKI